MLNVWLAELFTLHGLGSLLLLTLMEIVLGVDNIIFISIVAGKLPRELQNKARTIGLSLAFVFRVLLLSTISWLVGLKAEIFSIAGHGFSGKHLILLLGGIFLFYNTGSEIIEKLRGHEEDRKFNPKPLSMFAAILQIVLIDIIFSFDSILAAIGVARNLIIMVLAVMISLFIMLKFSRFIGDYINDNPTIKTLALTFLLLIASILIMEGFDVDFPKEYVYFALGFSLLNEFVNLRVRKKELKSEKSPTENKKVEMAESITSIVK